MAHIPNHDPGDEHEDPPQRARVSIRREAP